MANVARVHRSGEPNLQQVRRFAACHELGLDKVEVQPRSRASGDGGVGSGRGMQVGWRHTHMVRWRGLMKLQSFRSFGRCRLYRRKGACRLQRPNFVRFAVQRTAEIGNA